MRRCRNCTVTSPAEKSAGLSSRTSFSVLPAIEHTHVSDLEIGTSRTAVAFGAYLTIAAHAALAAVANNDFGTSLGAGDVDPVALNLLNAKLPNGQFLFPSANPNFTPTLNFPENVFLTQAAYFIADQAVANLDYMATSKDTLAFKYYYQHDPTTAPFGYSSVAGFTQHLDAGSQVATITNTQIDYAELQRRRNFRLHSREDLQHD